MIYLPLANFLPNRHLIASRSFISCRMSVRPVLEQLLIAKLLRIRKVDIIMKIYVRFCRRVVTLNVLDGGDFIHSIHHRSIDYVQSFPDRPETSETLLDGSIATVIFPDFP